MDNGVQSEPSRKGIYRWCIAIVLLVGLLALANSAAERLTRTEVGRAQTVSELPGVIRNTLQHLEIRGPVRYVCFRDRLRGGYACFASATTDLASLGAFEGRFAQRLNRISRTDPDTDFQYRIRRAAERAPDLVTSFDRDDFLLSGSIPPGDFIVLHYRRRDGAFTLEITRGGSSSP